MVAMNAQVYAVGSEADLEEGESILIKMNAASGATPTLNLGQQGALTVLNRFGAVPPAGAFRADAWYRLFRTSDGLVAPGIGGGSNLSVQELTASGAVLEGVDVLELNHATVVIAATMTVKPNTIFIVKDTSASGTAAHTLTLTGGTFNGTNTVATLNARDEFLMVHFDSAGRGQVIANVGAVALS